MLSQKKYNIKNLGCRNSVRKGIDWFFKYNYFGIILEDDCLPNKSFFEFCSKINKIYKNKKKFIQFLVQIFIIKKLNMIIFIQSIIIAGDGQHGEEPGISMMIN